MTGSWPIKPEMTSLKILFYGMNYAPEQIGISVYSTGLCEAFAEAGHSVQAVVAKPYYPKWVIDPLWQGGGWRRTIENGVTILRCPLYVPARPTGLKRLIHHVSFLMAGFFPMMTRAVRFRPDVVITVAPSLIAAPVAWLAAKVSGATCLVHVQDFEVEAAFATGLLDPTKPYARIGRWFERSVLGLFDRCSSISPEMCAKLAEIGIDRQRIIEFRNWTDVDAIYPLQAPSPYRAEWGIATPHVALYSGNIANKQGLNVVIDAARELKARTDITFVVCGNGPQRAELEDSARDLQNIQFRDLQPMERLNDLMGLATIHLLPQKADAADLVLPSKLGNMMASGRPVIATAHADTGLARAVGDGGLVIAPENHRMLAEAISHLADQPTEYDALAKNARSIAETNMSKIAIVNRFIASLGAFRSLSHNTADMRSGV